MLQTLTVSDFVIVDRLELDIDKGFTVLTGETGAGKSLLIDAIDLLLGGRADTTVVRQGAARADLSAQFETSQLPAVQAWLAEAGLEAEEGCVLIRRSVDASGKSKAWINGQAATLSQLREVGEMLVDIHGQHAHQALLRPNAQRQLLDTHANLLGQVKSVQSAWQQWQQAREQLERAHEQAERLAEIKAQLQWKLDEISALKLAPNDWETLSEEQKRLAHGAELLQVAQQSLSQLSEDETALASQTESIAQRLRQLLIKDSRLAPAVEALDQAAIQLHEASDTLSRYLDKNDLDPARLAEVESRVEAIFTVARKLRARPEELIRIWDQAQRDLTAAEQAADIESLQRLEQQCSAQYLAQAKKLSGERTKACKKLSAAVNQWFAQLAMGDMLFEAVCEARPAPSASGLEEIVFTLKSHPGASAFPLSKVASGGELARISLAISVVTSSAHEVPTLIFDEVDVGIGGNVAHTIGQLLRSLGSDRQVLCVTHLPQVAARGHHHLQVSKAASKDGQPLSRLTLLNAQTRIEEIARMLGDEGAKETSREHARSLIKLAETTTLV